MVWNIPPEIPFNDINMKPKRGKLTKFHNRMGWEVKIYLLDFQDKKKKKESITPKS